MMKKNTALNNAIEALEYKRARVYTVGHNAYKQGVKSRWSETTHKNYLSYTEAIEVLEGLKDD